jgi:hypothetical protein
MEHQKFMAQEAAAMQAAQAQMQPQGQPKPKAGEEKKPPEQAPELSAPPPIQ